VSGTEAAAAGGPRSRRKSPWALVAGILAAILIVVVLAVAFGRPGKSNGPAAAVSPTTTSPSSGSPATTAHGLTTPPPTTLGAAAPPVTLSTSAGATPSTATPPVTAAADVSNLGRWFAAVTPASCQPAPAAERIRGVSESVNCIYPDVVANFSSLGAVRDGPAYLAVLARQHPNSTVTAWSADGVSGEEIAYLSTRGRALSWTYSGQRYLATAVGSSASAVAEWWASVGRTLAAGAA